MTSKIAIQYAAQFLRLVEDEVLEAYLDSEGIVTIGVGITAYFKPELKLGDTITAEESTELLEKVLAHFEEGLANMPGWNLLTSTQQAAFLSFSYNTGWYPGMAGYDTLNRAVAVSGSNVAVTKAFNLYVNPGSSSELGLRRRRRAEGLLWFGNRPKTAVERAWREIK